MGNSVFAAKEVEIHAVLYYTLIMLKKAKRYFNTSGPNRPEEHYTLSRKQLVTDGIDLVEKERYFTVWAPRQTGKSTYILLLRERLLKKGYKVSYVNLENFRDEPLDILMRHLTREMNEAWGMNLQSRTLGMLYDDIKKSDNPNKCVIIIDEIEGLNPDLFNQFLHTLRNLYHFRGQHCLKSVVLVGVSNIVGMVQDNASPFNIADNLKISYFSSAETEQLLRMHEEETGQLFETQVKEKICDITANQPGLVNAFAYRLVTTYPEDKSINYQHYLEVEDWFLTEAIDKNISNIINKAKQHRRFVEQLLFTENKQRFKINDEKIKFLYSHGLLRKDKEGYVEFWVPMYKKAIYDAFYPYSNGESDLFFRNVDLKSLFSENGKIRFDLLIENYRGYVKKRSFRYFREKNPETQEYMSLKEAALAYSFETYIQTFVQALDGYSYLEPHSGLGRCDLLLNIRDHEYVVEFKIYRDNLRFEKGKTQLAYYTASLGIKEGVYLVFVPNTVTLPGLEDGVEKIGDSEIKTFIVHYDEDKDF